MKKLVKVLILEGISSIVLAYLMFYVIKLSTPIEVLYLPFDWIGKGLRLLSLSSSIGNILALICYIFLALCPIFYLLTIRVRGGSKKVDLLLPLISIYLFYMIYEFINPSFMLDRLPPPVSDSSMLSVIKLAFAIIFYSLCFGYLILRVIGNLSIDHSNDRMLFLCKKLSKILIVGSAFYTFFIGYFSTFQLFVGLNKYSGSSNMMPIFAGPIAIQNNSSLDQFIVVLNYILQGLPILFAIYILLAGIQLLNVMASHHMKEEEFQAASKLSTISKKAVYITIFSNLALNGVQFLLSNQLSDSAYNLEIVLSPLIIAFFAMILSGYFKETKELQEDNEMII